MMTRKTWRNALQYIWNKPPLPDPERYQKALTYYAQHKKTLGKAYYIHRRMEEAVEHLLLCFMDNEKADAWRNLRAECYPRPIDHYTALQEVATTLHQDTSIPQEITQPFLVCFERLWNVNSVQLERLKQQPQALNDIFKELAQCTLLPTDPNHDKDFYAVTKKAIHETICRYIARQEGLRQNNTRKIIGSIMLLGGACLMGKAYANTNEFTIHTHNLSGSHIPRGLDGRAIINLSDIHIHQNNITNVDEKTLFRKYFSLLAQELCLANIPTEKTILVMPGDFVSQKVLANNESDWEYVSEVLPLLNLIPGKYRYVTFGNHDEIHTHTEELRKRFINNNFRVLDTPEQPIEIDTATFQEQKVAIIGLPDFLLRPGDLTSQRLQDVVTTTQQAAFSILLVHNLDAIDPYLAKLRNTYIATGHTHRFHINLPIVKDLINHWQLHFSSSYYAGRYDLPHNVHIDNCPGINNSPNIPFRINATPGATITYLHHIPTDQ